MAKWKAVERVVYQDEDGHTAVIEEGKTTDKEDVVRNSPTSFVEEGKEDDDAEDDGKGSAR